MNKYTRRISDDAESGFGLIEILVSMFLLALLATFFLPLLIESMRVTVTNATVATASQLVSTQLDELRAIAPNCADVSAFDDATPATTTDAKGTIYQPHRTVATCPAAYPGLIRVTVSVTRSGETDPLAEAVTLVYLSSAAATP